MPSLNSTSTALVVGTTIDTVIDPKSYLVVLVPGLCFGLAAIICDGLSHREAHASRKRRICVPADKEDDSPSAGEEPQPTSETDASSFQSFWDFLPAAVGSSEVRKGIFLSMLCGVFSSSWSPFTSLAMTREHHTKPLIPYTCYLVWVFAIYLISWLLVVFLLSYPIVGEPGSIRDYFHIPWRLKFLGMLGGIFWGIGDMLNFTAGSRAGFAVSYAIVQCAPVVSVAYGIFVWKEYTHTSVKAKAFLGATVFFYLGCVTLVALSSFLCTSDNTCGWQV